MSKLLTIKTGLSFKENEIYVRISNIVYYRLGKEIKRMIKDEK